MAVGFKVKYYWYQIGTGDFLYSFFSTIAFKLETGKWGSKYPYIMNELYNGNLQKDHIAMAMKELDVIVSELKKFPPSEVVWDFEDVSKQPPWGNKISSDITDLSNYFVTSDGEDFISVLRCALEDGLKYNEHVCIESL